MSIDINPDFGGAQIETENPSEAVAETKEDPREKYADNMDFWQDYDLTIEVFRAYMKRVESEGLGGSPKEAKKYESVSPLVRGLLHFGEIKAKLGAKANGRGDFEKEGPIPGSRPEFMKLFPDHFEHTVVSKENAEEFGLKPETFEDNETLRLPVELTFPVSVQETVKPGHKVEDDVAIEALLNAKGVGEKTAVAILEALDEAGLKVAKA